MIRHAIASIAVAGSAIAGGHHIATHHNAAHAVAPIHHVQRAHTGKSVTGYHAPKLYKTPSFGHKGGKHK